MKFYQKFCRVFCGCLAINVFGINLYAGGGEKRALSDDSEEEEEQISKHKRGPHEARSKLRQQSNFSEYIRKSLQVCDFNQMSTILEEELKKSKSAKRHDFDCWANGCLG